MATVFYLYLVILKSKEGYLRMQYYTVGICYREAMCLI